MLSLSYRLARKTKLLSSSSTSMASFSILPNALLLILLFVSFVRAEATCFPQDLMALSHFKAQLSNFRQEWWNDTVDCCSWYGVSCVPLIPSTHPPYYSRVRSLSLPSFRLKGGLTGLANLTALQSLNLSRNSLYGTAADDLAPLTRLESLDLSINNLTGEITFLGGFQSLRFVNISSNSFTGGLPSLINLTFLETFSARNNRIRGQLRFSVCEHAHNVRMLDFSMNRLIKFGDGVRNCTALEMLDVGYNNITSRIPSEVFALSSLVRLNLESNFFTGMLNEDLGNLFNLQELILGSNALSGPIPKSLSNCTMLRILDLSNNTFHGSMNLNYHNLQKLQVLKLNKNLFHGSISSVLGKCSALQFLNLAANQLEGEIPMQFNDLHNLTTLSLSTNHLNGSLSALTGCINLKTLVLSRNRFTDPLPANITGFTNLEVLVLAYMDLRGQIPSWLRNCKKLHLLDLSWNSFRGALPQWIGDFQHLFYIDLANNSFTGNLPPQLFRLPALIHINSTSLSITQQLMLISKRGSKSVILNYRQATAFPPSLYLSHNHFVGSIPVEVGKLRRLFNLDLSSNQLTGPIPETLANATLLEYLDLSVNNLTGSIPHSLAGLTFLSFFNVSFNHLVGRIPASNQFLTFTSESYEGNDELCGPPLSNGCKLPASALFPPSIQGSKGSNVDMIISRGLGFFLGVLLMVVLFWTHSRRKCGRGFY